jgi:protocatechuate 3,4-dioxygenase beta subunit
MTPVPTHELKSFYIPLERRRFLKAIALASAGFTLPGYLAEALTLAPSVTQGPYYPLAKNIPLDDDNDLLYLNSNTTAASGIITYLSGRILDASGNPIKDALVEIWHADNGGNYIYSASATRNSAADANFQGFGQFLTGSSGQYLFRTVKAGLYQGRTRHYHLAVTVPGQKTRYCTQTFWNETAYTSSGQAWSIQNSNDSVLQGVTNTAQRSAITLNYTTVDSTIGSVGATFDFAVGLTPTEPTYPNGGSFLAQGTMVTGPSSAPRFQLTIPAYTGYTYEIYANPTLADTAWGAVPFSLTQTGTIDRNRYTATSEGSLNLYVTAQALKGFYHVSFRVPGANTGTP